MRVTGSDNEPHDYRLSSHGSKEHKEFLQAVKKIDDQISASVRPASARPPTAVPRVLQWLCVSIAAQKKMHGLDAAHFV